MGRITSIEARIFVLARFAVICSALAVPSSATGDEAAPAKEPARYMLINPDGTNLRVLFESDDRFRGSPQWSPDGKLLAYDTWDNEETLSDARIEVAELDGTVKYRLGKGAMPSWSPDGKQIVCHTYESPQTIVVMDVEGNGRETIMHHWGSPRWSPKGDRIVSAHTSGGISIFDLKTGHEWILAPQHMLWQGLSISPDGSMICFGDQQGGAAIATLNHDATKASTKWILQTGQTYHSAWSPDGKMVVLNWRATPEDVEQLYLYDLETQDAPELLKGQDPQRNSREVAWSPDGESILFMSVPR